MNCVRQSRKAGRSGRTSFVLGAILLLAAHGASASGAATLTEEQIKAGFLFNFIRFVEWPPRSYASPVSPITVCVIGETGITPMLTEAANGRTVDGREVQVKRLKLNDDLHGCQLIYIPSTEPERWKALLERTSDTDTLTVGEDSSFTQEGGVLSFFIQDNRVKLALNLNAANRAGLRISAKLIAVSKLVQERDSGGGR